MSVQFPCSNPECGTKLEVGDELAGKKVKCPKCKTVMVVPRPDSGTDASDSTGYEATMALEEKLVEEEQPEEDGVEGLDSHLSRKRGQEPPFEVEKEIARGGMGAVILARDKAIQRELAVKVIRPEVADSEEHRLRFLEEAQVTGQLEHPNIVPIHELGKDAEGNLYFTMKLVKGKSLGEIVKEIKDAEAEASGVSGQVSGEDGRPETRNLKPEIPNLPTLSDLLNAFLKSCDGIAFAHSKGVIHRDLKPDNIMVGEFGEVQIMDWGLAKVVGQDQRAETKDQRPEEGKSEANVEHPMPNAERPTSESELRRADTVPAGGPQSAIRNQESVRSVRSGSDIALTVDGQITGTPAYMPPEQAEGKLEMIDHRSDVYSLGAILYEILTLERPIEGDTVHKVLLNVSDGKITPPEQRTPDRHVPKELSAVVMQAMAKNRRQRYQSVQDLGQDIKLFLEGRSVSAREDSFVESVGKLIKRNKGISAAIAVAAALVLTIGTVFTIDNMNKRLEAEAARDEAVSAREEQRTTALKASMMAAEQAARAAGEGRFDEAEIRAEASEEIAPWGPWGAYAQGAIAWERRELEEAEEHLRAAREKAKEEPTIRNLLVRVQAAIGKAKEAASLLENLDNIEKWEDLLAAGDVLYGVEDYRRAQTLYDAAVKKMKADPTVTPERLWLAEDKLGNARAWVKCEGFYESVKDLPAQEQYTRIAAKLEEIHGRGVRLLTKVVDGVLRDVHFDDRGAKYLQPLSGMTLTKLDCHSTRVCDLTPLKGIPLTEFDCYNTRVSDLGPLSGMPLRNLNCRFTRVKALGPLEGMPLEVLACSSTGVSDLSPLKGMLLTSLDCSRSSVSDLRPLAGMPLTTLNCYYTGVGDLGPLRGMPLTRLNCGSTGVRDLRPLAGMRLTTLDCEDTQVSDLGPLAGMPLGYLNCQGTHVRDFGPLAGMPLALLNVRHPKQQLTPESLALIKRLKEQGCRVLE